MLACLYWRRGNPPHDGVDQGRRAELQSTPESSQSCEREQEVEDMASGPGLPASPNSPSGLTPLLPCSSLQLIPPLFPSHNVGVYASVEEVGLQERPQQSDPGSRSLNLGEQCVHVLGAHTLAWACDAMWGRSPQPPQRPSPGAPPVMLKWIAADRKWTDFFQGHLPPRSDRRQTTGL